MGKHLWLFISIQSVAACVVGWALLVVALTTGFIDATTIALCIGVGFIAGFPIAGDIVRRMTND